MKRLPRFDRETVLAGAGAPTRDRNSPQYIHNIFYVLTAFSTAIMQYQDSSFQSNHTDFPHQTPSPNTIDHSSRRFAKLWLEFNKIWHMLPSGRTLHEVLTQYENVSASEAPPLWTNLYMLSRNHR